MAETMSLSEFAIKLFDIEAVKFGQYTLKTGIQSPIYIDFRSIISYPDIMATACKMLWTTAQPNSQFDFLCGVPMTALTFATHIATKHELPMVLRRKEAKSYGTMKLLLGHYQPGTVCLVVEDVVTSGSSVLETVEVLSAAGIIVRDAVVLLGREQGGKDILKQKGITLHSVMTMRDLLRMLFDAGKIDQSAVDNVKTFLANNQCSIPPQMPDNKSDEVKILSYEERSALSKNLLTQRLLKIMATKKTNLALSADVSESKELLKLADDIGPHICVLKTHIDELRDFSETIVTQLKTLALKHNFLIFEDRKFADIGHTVQQQFEGGMYRISEWADIIDAHSLPGPGIVEGLKEVNLSKGCLLIAEMSSKGNLLTDDYTKATVKIAEDHRDFVIGFICTKRISNDPSFIHFTPGVHLESKGDTKGQQYLTPMEVIANRHSDVIIVGRGIVKAVDPIAAARLYQEAGYTAYLKQL